MEFDVTSLAFGGEQHISRWDAERIRGLKPDDTQSLTKILDVFGKASAVAQGLGAPVTDIYRLRSTDQRLYLYMYRNSSKTVVLGGLKVGTKRLFVRMINAELREVEPVCVLDFYVHESCQRQGIGKGLFEHFLSAEGLDPGMLAYDRPSPKLMGFLKKHYGLTDYVPQSNNYVIFNRYWDLCPHAVGGRHGQARAGASRGGGVHPLHGPRATPPLPSPGVPPGWGPGAAPGMSPLGTPSAIGRAPSFGQRWAQSNFGSSAMQGGAGAGGGPGSPPGGGPMGLHVGVLPGEGGHGDSGGPYSPSHGDSLDAFARGQGQGYPHGGSPPQHQPSPYASGPQQHQPWGPAHAGGQLGYGEVPHGPGPFPGFNAPPGAAGRGTPGGAPPGSAARSQGLRTPWALDEHPQQGPGAAGRAAGGMAGPGGAAGGYPPSTPPYGISEPMPQYQQYQPPPPQQQQQQQQRLTPPWGVSDSPPSYPPQRTPPPGSMGSMQSPYGGAGAGGAHGKDPANRYVPGGTGPHMRALQEQLSALQVAGHGTVTPTGSVTSPTAQPLYPSAGVGLGARPAGTPEGQRQGSMSGAGGGVQAAGTPGRGMARITAVAQRSGAGAADCLVW